MTNLTENREELENEIYKDLIYSILEEYKTEFNNKFPGQNLGYSLTITDQELDTSKIFEQKEKGEKINVKYVRLEESVLSFNYRTPLEEEFIHGFQYQLLIEDKKCWEEREWNDDITSLSNLIEEGKVRIVQHDPPKVRVILAKGYPTDEEEPEEDMMNRIYKDLLYHLISGGIEHLAFIALQRERQKELDKLQLDPENSQVVTRKHMPDPLSKEDKEYVKWIKEQKAKLKNEKPKSK